MGEMTRQQPKCMTRLCTGESLISRQLRQLESAGVESVVITTGPFAEALQSHVREHAAGLNIAFAQNPDYENTNYIYSIFLARHLLMDDILLLHGDLVFEGAVLDALLQMKKSAVCVDSRKPLPEKDFKAVVQDGRVLKVGVEFFDQAVALQPLYVLLQRDWAIWQREMEAFVAKGITGVYAENALNEVGEACGICTYELAGSLCEEVDTPDDLSRINKLLCSA